MTHGKSHSFDSQRFWSKLSWFLIKVLIATFSPVALCVATLAVANDPLFEQDATSPCHSGKKCKAQQNPS